MRIILPGLITLTILSVAASQIRDNPKLPSDVGLGCVDVTKKLNSPVKDGRMVVARCCQGMKLVADVTEEGSREGKKKKIVGWHVFGSDGNELEGEKGEVRRQNTSDSKSSESLEIYETIVVVQRPEACFIVDRTEKKLR